MIHKYFRLKILPGEYLNYIEYMDYKGLITVQSKGKANVYSDDQLKEFLDKGIISNPTLLDLIKDCVGCYYCYKEESIINHTVYKNGGVSGEPDLGVATWINSETKELTTECDTDYQTKKIRFCPMCGRPLNEEIE